MPTEADIARYFDSKVDCCTRGRRAEKALWHRATALLRAELPALVPGRSVLEIGCGEGDLLRALVQAGASRGTGMDLAGAALEEARRRAQAEGLAGRVTFRAGNGAGDALEPHDVVVLDKVICCYPHVEQMLGNTLPAARAVYAFTLPRTDGIWAVLTPVAILLENLGHRLARRGFRAYAHPERDVHAAVTAAGFRLRARRTRFAWSLRVYERA